MMEILRKDDGRIQFQYKLVDGQIDNSYASHTALCMGIPKDIVARADQVSASAGYVRQRAVFTGSDFRSTLI